MRLFKTNLLFVFFLSVFTYSVYAQEDNSKFSFDIGIGNSSVVARSNYSSFGGAYRANYNDGLQINSKLLYQLKDKTYLGLKYNLFSSGANYSLQEGSRILENLTVNYIAPQIGLSYRLGSKFSIMHSVGVGYAIYHSNGIKNTEEYNVLSHLLAANVDLSLYYKISPKISLGITPSCFTDIFSGKITKKIDKTTTTIEPNKWDKLNLSRFDFSINLKVDF